MPNDKPSNPVHANDGYTPVPLNKGHQPVAARPPGTSGAQGGHQPTTGQGPTGTPPNQGSGGQSGGNKK